MESGNKYDYLIIRYLDKSITDQDLQELYHWLRADKSNFEAFIEQKDIWDNTELARYTEHDAESALTDFYNYTKGVNKPLKKPKNRIIFYTARIAATLLLAVLLSAGYQWINKLKTPTTGKSIGYSEVIIPTGQKGNVTLPDGTRIWLNSSTTLRYRSAFNEKNRKVYINGEAFLEVSKDPERPFLVETTKLTLKVLGTSFNIKCYSDENTVETTLIEGSLKIMPNIRSFGKISEVILKPNEKATYNIDKDLFLVDQLDIETSTAVNSKTAVSPSGISEVESIISWKNNELIFNNETLEQVCTKMEHWYGITIHIDEQLKERGYLYSGKFVYNETVSQVMDILARTTPIKFSIDKNILTIKLK